MGKKSNSPIVNYDTILDHIGQFGPWQQRIHFLLWLTSAAGGLAVVVYSFTAFKTPYICKPSQCESEDITYDGIAKAFVSAKTGLAIPRIENNVCQYVALQLNSNPSQTEEISCNEYINRTIDVFNSNTKYENTTCKKTDLLYDDTYVTSSLIQDYGFTCQDENLRVIYAASYMLGMLFGSFFIGQFSDRYGRMPALMLGLILVSGSGFLGAFMNDMHGYGFFRFLTGIGGIACFMVTFVICVEYVGVKYTMLTGIAIEIPFALGEIVLGIEAYLVRDWFTLQIVAYAPLIALLVLWFLVPESPRWLLAKGRVEEAKNILTKGAKINKKSLPDELFQPSVDSSTTANDENVAEKPTLMDLFRPNIILKRTLNMGFQWFSVTMCYYGLSFAATDLLGDPYTNALLSYAIEIPGYVFCIIVMDRWGRRPILSFCQILSGISCIGSGLMFLDPSPEGAIFQTILSLLGKFNAAACFAIVYVYTAELFPTVIRNTAVGTCSTIARVGGICSILIGFIPSKLAIMVIMGIVASIAGTLAIFLPETLGNPLPETMEDATNIGKDSKRGFCTCTSPPK